MSLLFFLGGMDIVDVSFPAIIISIIDFMFGIAFLVMLGGFLFACKRVNRKSIGLDKSEILKEIIPGCGVVFLAAFIFGTVGIALITGGSVAINDNSYIGIYMMLFGSLLIAIFSIATIRKVRPIINVLRGNYVVIKDVLKDRDERYHHDSDKHRRPLRLFYFKDYFTKFNSGVVVTKELFERSLNGDEFYLIFIRGENTLAYRCKEAQIAPEVAKKIIPIEKLKDYTKEKEFKIKEKDPFLEKKDVNKSDIVWDTFKKRIPTIFIYFIVSAFLISSIFFILFVFEVNKLAVILVILMLFVVVAMLVLQIGFIFKVNSSMKNNKYVVKLDTVMSINERFGFKDTNNLVKLKFKNTKKSVILKRVEFPNVQVDDEFYLIFIGGESEPIEVYDKRDVNLNL